ncbi:MAG: PQQ-binding-like beta-propeller repeat protein [Nannocystaceae bacterium]
MSATSPSEGPALVDLEAIRGWSRRLAGVLEPTRPRVVGSIVLVTTTDRVVGLDLAKGTPLWTTKLDDTAYHTPIVRDDVVFIGDFSGRVRSLAAATGATRWVAKLSPEQYGGMWRPALSSDGYAAIAATDGSVYGFNPDSGALCWRYTSPAAATEEEFQDTLLGVGSRILGTSCAGELLAWSAADGVIAWRRPMRDRMPNLGYRRDLFDLGDARIILLGGSGRHHCVVERVDPRTGAALWSVDVPDTGAPQRAVAIGPDLLVMGVHCVVRLSGADGAEQWRHIGSPVDLCVSADDSRVFVLSTHGVHELDGASGALLRATKPQKKRYFSTLVFEGDGLLISTFDGVLRLNWPH